MTAVDQTPRPSDKAAGSTLVDETMNALSDLLGRVELSEERVSQIIVAVCAITTDAAPSQSSDTCDPSSLSLDDTGLAAADASGGKPLPNQAEVVPQQRKIPSGHYEVTINKVTFIVPFAGEPEPLYLVTKEKMVGVFSSWENVSALVTRVSGATYRCLPSGTSISQACQMMERAIVDDVVTPNGKKTAPVTL